MGLPDEQAATNDQSVPNLQQLITEQKNLRNRSYGDYERMAGYVISRQRWQQLGTGARIKEFSEPATIKAMAEALEVDVAVVVLAMAKSLGLPIESGVAQSDLAVMLPPSARKLTPEQRDAIVRLVRVFAPEEDEHHADQPDVTTDSSTPARASGKAHEDQEAKRYVVFRNTSAAPDQIIQGETIEASDDDDAHYQLQRALRLAGIPVDSRSDHTITVTEQGDDYTLIGLVREDASIDREKWFLTKLRDRANQIDEDSAAGSGGFLRAAARAVGGGRQPEGRVMRDAQDAEAEGSQIPPEAQEADEEFKRLVDLTDSAANEDGNGGLNAG